MYMHVYAVYTSCIYIILMSINICWYKFYNFYVFLTIWLDVACIIIYNKNIIKMTKYEYDFSVMIAYKT